MDADIISKFQSYKNLEYLIVVNEEGRILFSKPEIKEENKEEKLKVEEIANALHSMYTTLKAISKVADTSIFLDAKMRYKKAIVTVIPGAKFTLFAIQNKD